MKHRHGFLRLPKSTGKWPPVVLSCSLSSTASSGYVTPIRLCAPSARQQLPSALCVFCFVSSQLHTFYAFSLNAFVVMFLRGLDVVGGGGGGGTGGGMGAVAESRGPASPKLDSLADAFVASPSGKQRFKAAARSVITTKRFEWNSDLLKLSRTPSDLKQMTGKVRCCAMGTRDLASCHSLLVSSIQKPAKALSAPELKRRVEDLTMSVTSTVFNFMRRALFEKHKVAVAAQLSFKVSCAFRCCA